MQCSICNTDYPETTEYFYFHNGKRHSRKCKQCHNRINRENRLRNHEYYQQYELNRREQHQAEKQAWYQENKKHVSEYNKQYQEKNKEKVRGLNRSWRKNNPDKVKASHKRYNAKKPHDPQLKLAHSVRNNVLRGLKRYKERPEKAARSIKLLGCTIPELKTYLESKFLPGMTWENHGLHGWHIDHIKPLSSFDLTKPKEQEKAFHYTNLQPLWAKDNLSKGNKVT
jgi:hypothetical protein